MFVDFDNLGMLPLDMDDELRPRAPPSASSSQDSREDFEIVAERCDEGAPAAEMRGFAGWCDRGTVARARRGAFEGPVHEHDPADKFWNLRRWALRPAVLLYGYEPHRGDAPVSVTDLGGFEALAEGPAELRLAPRAAGEPEVRARFTTSDDVDRFRASLADLDVVAQGDARRRAEAAVEAAESELDDLRARARDLEAAAAARDRDARLGEERAEALAAALHAVRGAAQGHRSTLASTVLRPREVSEAVLRELARLRDAGAASAAAAAALARERDAAAAAAARRVEAAAADAAAARRDRDAARRALDADRCDAELQTASRQAADRAEAKRRRQEKKLLVDAVRDLRRRLRRLSDAERHRDSVAQFWGPDGAPDGGAPPPPPEDEEEDADADDWLGAYLRAADDAPDSEEEEEKPALRVRDLAEGTVRQGRSQRIPPAPAPAPAKKRRDRRSQASKDFSKALDLVKAKAVRARATLAQAAARPAADPDEVEAI